MQNAQLYISGENFLIIAGRKGMNAQQNFGGTTDNVFSSAKSLVSGVNITF
jgi:hypothetical protein